MSTRLSALAAFPDGLAGAEDPAGRRPVGVACPRGSANVEPRVTRAVDGEQEVYCRRHGTEHAAKGFAPCSDLGCAGCDIACAVLSGAARGRASCEL